MSALEPALIGEVNPYPARAAKGLWKDAWRRLQRNRLAIAVIVYLALLALVALLAPVIAPHNPVRADPLHAGVFRQAAWISNPDLLRSGSWDYPLGTDSVGRDVFSQLVYGTRVSLVVGLIPMVLTLLIGIAVGLLAGFAGDWIDSVLMRLTDVVYAFPSLLLFILMLVSFRDTAIGNLLNGLVLLFISLSVVSWVGVARLVRGEVLALKARDFVEAARAIGSSNGRIVLRHILPNALSPIIIAGAYIVPGAIIAEAILSYLGIGIRPAIQPDAPFPTSWGTMILEGFQGRESQPWMLIAPTLAVALITVAFTFLGDGLRDALDPRQDR